MEKLSKPNGYSGASMNKNVICVLSQEQYNDYEDELSEMKAFGARLSLVEDPDEALAMVSKVKPDMIIVGMDVGDMEGFEFLAMLTSSVPDYENPAVVLPDKSDGLPPVVHSRNQDTGHSAVDGVDFNYITSLLYPTESDEPNTVQKATVESKSKESSPTVDEPKAKPVVDHKPPTVGKPEAKPIVDHKPPSDDKPEAKPAVDQKLPVDDTEKAKPTVDKEPTAPKEEKLQPFTIDFPSDPSIRKPNPIRAIDDPPAALLEEQAPILAPRSTSRIDKRFLILGGAVALVLISIGGYVGLSGSGESKSLEPASQEGNVAASSRIDEDKQGVGDQTDDQNQDEINPTPETASDKAELAVDTTAETGKEQNDSVDPPEEDNTEVGLQLPKELILPLSFNKGSSEAEIIDEHRLDQIVQALSNRENTQIVLTGHASVHGKSDINYKLGLQRAEAAKKLLVERQIPSNRIRTASLGSHVPISEKDEEEAQQHNRRVAVTLQ